eukprot:13256533-Alexandrium_andersonii.AAC.1
MSVSNRRLPRTQAKALSQRTERGDLGSLPTLTPMPVSQCQHYHECSCPTARATTTVRATTTARA